MKKAFQIYKEGRTSDWVTILCPINEFNIEWLKRKLAFYESLGYSIKSI
jgi:hypothetical protein